MTESLKKTMSVELGYIADGQLCQFYGFTLTESRSLDDIERDIFLRYMSIVNRVQNKKRTGTGGYDDE